METRRDVFQAIADPTRRAIIALLATQSLNLNAVAQNFDISRPAVSQHMKILAECGLVEIRQEGRERYCEAKLEPLNEVSSWAESARSLWMHRLSALESYLEELQAASGTKAHKTKTHGKKKRNKKHG